MARARGADEGGRIASLWRSKGLASLWRARGSGEGVGQLRAPAREADRLGAHARGAGEGLYAGRREGASRPTGNHRSVGLWRKGEGAWCCGRRRLFSTRLRELAKATPGAGSLTASPLSASRHRCVRRMPPLRPPCAALESSVRYCPAFLTASSAKPSV